MGSYADLRLGEYLILSQSDRADAVALMTFDESDQFHEIDASGQTPDIFGYRASVAVVRDRLDSMGFTLPAARDFFASAAKSRIQHLLDQEWSSPSADCEVRVLKRLTFEGWLDAFTDMKRANLQSWNQTEESFSITRSDPDLYDYLLDEDAEHFHGFPFGDFRYFMRAAAETCDSEEIVVYDLSDTLRGGYYSVGERIVDHAREALLADFPVNAPIVVITEGSTDRVILQSAMRVVAPHLISYYSFFDFAAASAKGGASAVVETVKAFIAAKVVNRVVALLDNDTAAEVALRALANVKIPSNIRIRSLPPIASATAYPTLGPTGPVQMDVNGLAGSIELYLGRDVLTREDGTLTPVQWLGYETTLGRYQGEVMNKRELQERFATKVEVALRDPALRATQDWTDLIAILGVIRAPF